MKTFLIIIYCLALLLCSCGSSSEVEGRTAFIQGKVVYPNGTPVEGASVHVRPSKYLAFYPEQFIACDTTTDDNGYFYFDTLTTDSYVVEINKNGVFGALQTFTINVNDTLPIMLPDQTVLATGTIKGKINLPITDDTLRPLVAIYGMKYLKKTMVTQDFIFEGIPPGVYNLRIVPDLKSTLVMELRAVKVLSDSVTDVGCLNLRVQQFFNGCTSPSCDSAAIRSILDANGLFLVKVSTVAVFDSISQRVVELNLSNLSLSTITKDIGSLSELRTLDLRANNLRSLPSSMEYLGTLQNCYLDSNKLHELPVEFTYLKSLRVLTASNNLLDKIGNEILGLNLVKLDLRNNQLQNLPDNNRILPVVRYIYLDHNNLQSLPERILHTYPEEFSISYNRMCNVSDELSQFISFFDKSWSESQICGNN